MSLSFNTQSSFVIAFLPRSKCLLILWLQLPSTMILEPKKMKSVLLPFFLIYLPWSGGTRCHLILVFWMLSFKPTFSLSSFTLPWKRTWQPIPVFLPGEYHGQRSLADIVRGVAKSQTQLSHYPSSLFHPHQEPLQLLFPFCLRVVSSAYLSLLMFLLTIFVPAGNQENEKDAPCQLLTRKWRSWNSHTLGVGCRHFGNLWHFWMTQ